MLQEQLIEIAIEGWRFSRDVMRAFEKLNPADTKRYMSRLRFFERQLQSSLESAGLTLVNLEGHPFESGMAATALNLGDFGPDSILVVDQMLEPIVMGPDGPRRQGTVTLREGTR